MSEPQQQPNEYIITECMVADTAFMMRDAGLKYTADAFEEVVRSRPHPAPQAPDEMEQRFETKREAWEQGYQDGRSAVQHDLNLISAEAENPCIENGCTDIEDCDEICQHSRIFSPLQMQQARREERERVLDELYAWLSEKVEPHEAAMRVLTIGEKIKSLREGAK